MNNLFGSNGKNDLAKKEKGDKIELTESQEHNLQIAFEVILEDILIDGRSEVVIAELLVNLVKDILE